MLEGRWKMVILFQLFARPVLRFSELERAIPKVSQKMLAQQLRDLERDGLIERRVYAEVPPKVEYRLTEWGQRALPRARSAPRMAQRMREGPLDGARRLPDPLMIDDVMSGPGGPRSGKRNQINDG